MRSVFFCIFLWAGSVSYGQKESKDSIRGTSVTSLSTFTDSTGKKTVWDSSVAEVYKMGDITLYILSYKEDAYFNEVELFRETRQHFFIHAKDSLFGIDYDGHKKPFISRIAVDSLLSNEWISNRPFENTLTNLNVNFIVSDKYTDPGTLRKIYQVTPKRDTIWQRATCFVDYKKLIPAVNLTIFKGCERIEGMFPYKMNIALEARPNIIGIYYAIDDIPVISQNIKNIFIDYLRKNAMPFDMEEDTN